MKIIYASTIDISLPNGPGVNEREFVHALQRRYGTNVGFVIPMPRHPAVMGGLQNCHTYGVWPKRLHHIVAEFALLRSLLATTRDDPPRLVVSRCGLLPMGLAAFVKLRSGIQFAMKTHGDPTLRYLCDSRGLKGFIGRMLRPASLWLSRFLVDRAIAVDFCTPQLVDRNLACHPGVPASRFLMVGNATNVEVFRPRDVNTARVVVGLPADSRVVGYVGGNPWERGGRQIIKAVRDLSRLHPKLMGVVVGSSGSGSDSLEAFAIAEGVSERCLFPGVVPYDDVPQWIASFDVGVAMDLPERAGYVGSSNQKIRQYLACGKPVIAAAGVNEFLEEEGLGETVAASDSAGFNAAVAKFLGEPAVESAERGARARRYAEANFSVDHTLSIRVEAWEQAGVVLSDLAQA